MINNLSDHKVDIIVNDSSIGLNYYGDYNLHLFDIDLKEIEIGIIETYEVLKTRVHM
jgi:hypothetical protein